MAMPKFLTEWAPVATWPEAERVTLSQAREALSLRESRYAFAEWQKRHDEASGTRGETVPKDYIFQAVKEKESYLEFLIIFQPDKWTAKLSIARLVFLLWRIHTVNPDGLFYKTNRDIDMVLSALFDLVVAVRDKYCPSKRSRSALVDLVLPDVKQTEKQKLNWPRLDYKEQEVENTPDSDEDTDVDWNMDDSAGAQEVDNMPDSDEDTEVDWDMDDTDAVGAAAVGAVGAVGAGAAVDDRAGAAAVVTAMAAAPDTNTALQMDTHRNNDKTLLQRLTSVPKPKDRDRIEEQVQHAIECQDKSDPVLDLPAIWPSGPSLKDSCRVLGISEKEPFHIPGTRPTQTFSWYQIKGIAHVKLCLLLYGQAALLDFMGLGKTRQSLVGLENALCAPIEPPSKPSLIIVPSGAVGEHWISEGLLAGKRFSFVAVGDGFPQDQHSPRVQYWRVPGLYERGLGVDPFVLFVCTFATMRKISDAEFVRKGFHTVVVDEMQQLRKWKESATFLSIDRLEPVWRIGLTATPLMNGIRDMKGFLAFFRDRNVDILKAKRRVEKKGKSPFDEGGSSEYQALPEMWEQYVDDAELQVQERALRQLPEAMPFVISRNLSTPNDDKSTTIGEKIPPLYVSRQTVTFGDPILKGSFIKEFNKLLRDLWKEENGRKFMQMQTLTNLATMTLSTFAARIPADQKFVQRLNAEGADLAAVCGAVLRRQVSDEEALELVCSPKLDWLAVFLGRTVVERGEKVLLFVLNNREQLLVGAFLRTLGLGPIANFHSGLSSKERSNIIDSFNRSGGPLVFIATWEMGSVGFNLQKNCRIVVALSLYYNRNAEMQGRARVHRPGQTRPVLYVQCRQSPSLDTVFMLKHADRKELVELYAQLQLAKRDQKNVDKILDAVSNAMAGLDGTDMQNALDLDLEEDVAMPAKYVETLQTILAKDSLQYYKSLEEL